MLADILIKTVHDYLRILPFIVLAYILIYLLRKFKIKQYAKKVKNKILLAYVLGILSHGPIYAWYPLLKELEFSEEELLAFFYLRGIKLPQIPLQIALLGLKLTLLLNSYLLIVPFLFLIKDLKSIKLKKESALRK